MVLGEEDGFEEVRVLQQWQRGGAHVTTSGGRGSSRCRCRCRGGLQQQAQDLERSETDDFGGLGGSMAGVAALVLSYRGEKGREGRKNEWKSELSRRSAKQQTLRTCRGTALPRRWASWAAAS